MTHEPELYDARAVSVVVPVYNEAENVAILAQWIHEAMRAYPHPWECIFVDDGSKDRTPARLKELQQAYGLHLRIVTLQRNFGQTAAMQAGIDTARGAFIATLDGDLQNDPKDIPRLVERLISEDLDLLVGWRKNRRDNFLIRKVPSWIANRLIGRVTGIRLHDYGCSLKVYRSSVIKSVRLYGEMHRFIPAWMAAFTSVSRIAEEEVAHHPRQYGQSKYGLSRTFRTILDLLVVYFFMKYRARPGHFFGSIGLAFGLAGGGILGYLGFVKIILGENIGTRPLLLVGVLFVIACLQFLTTGVIAEFIARTYFESSEVKSYVVRPSEPDSGPAPGESWCTTYETACDE
jgi:glycosyltransferase involved in cell wall biosynthesis